TPPPSPSLIVVARLGAATAVAMGAPPPPRRTCTLNPSVLRSFESATASRSGKLGRMRTLSPAVSEARPFAGSLVLISAGGPPVTITSYRSEADPVDADARGAGRGDSTAGPEPPTRLVDSST